MQTQTYCPISREQASQILIENGVDEDLAPSLTVFLYDSVKSTFTQVLARCSQRKTDKSSAKENQTLEQEAQDLFQGLKYVQK